MASTLTIWNPGWTRLTEPPRAVYTGLARAAALDQPGNAAQQLRVLRATLDLLAQDAPLEAVQLDEQ